TDAAAIEQVGALAREIREGPAEIGLHQELAERGALAAGYEDPPPFRVGVYRGELANDLAEHGAGRVSVGGPVNRRLEQLAERPRAEPLEQHCPAAPAAGHADGGGTRHRQAIHATPAQLLEARARARAARAVQIVDPSGRRLVVEAEDV